MGDCVPVSGYIGLYDPPLVFTKLESGPDAPQAKKTKKKSKSRISKGKTGAAGEQNWEVSSLDLYMTPPVLVRLGLEGGTYKHI